jgi:hypothetical protein
MITQSCRRHIYVNQAYDILERSRVSYNADLHCLYIGKYNWENVAHAFSSLRSMIYTEITITLSCNCYFYFHSLYLKDRRENVCLIRFWRPRISCPVLGPDDWSLRSDENVKHYMHISIEKMKKINTWKIPHVSNSH